MHQPKTLGIGQIRETPHLRKIGSYYSIPADGFFTYDQLYDDLDAHYAHVVDTGTQPPSIATMTANSLAGLRDADAENGERPLRTSVLDLFDQNAQANPHTVAAEFRARSMSYGELYDASVRVALELHKRGFRPRDRIPLVTNMSLEMLAAVLGILRLGAAYCPIDVNAWSSTRIISTLESIGSHLVFSTVDATLPGYEIVRVPDILSQEHLRVGDEPVSLFSDIRQGLKYCDLIYILFTSGTTGKPKGVMVPHGSAAHLVQQDIPGAMKGRPGEKVLLFFSVAFDGCAGVIFCTICHGGTLALTQPSEVINVASSCSTLIVTPSMLASLDPTPEFDKVHSIYMGGEAPTETLVRLWTTKSRKLYNCYGPTECTTAVSTIEMSPGAPIVLGHLISEVEIILLDENLEAEVEQGEICIRGPCLAIGYLNNEPLTQQKFFVRDGIRHYRTGDLARRGKDGLHFMARVDRVVKNRGFLINLEAEVEPALRSFPGVHQAAAFMFEKKLVGFLTPDHIPVGVLRKHLIKRCDAFIVPDLLFTTNEFPLTSNGKVDLKNLQVLAKARMKDQLEHWKSSDVESSAALDAVLEAFASVFDSPVGEIPPSASFSELGGHSLTAVKLQSRLRRDGLNIDFSKIFDLDTPVAISRSLSTIITPEMDSVVAEEHLTAPLTPHQLEMLSETKEDPSRNYNFYGLTRSNVNGTIMADQLHEVWETLFYRHDIYRSTFDLDAKTQTVHAKPDFIWKSFEVLDETDMEAVSRRERESLWTMLRSREPSLPILKPIFWIIDAPGHAMQMNWAAHHVYTDAWSFGIVLDEMETIINGQSSTLSPAPSYTGIAQHLSQEYDRQHDAIDSFWSDYTTIWSKLRHIQLPPPSNPSTKPWDTWGSDAHVRKSLLDSFSTENRVSSAAVIYTAWALTLVQYTGSNTVGMKISVSGRNIGHPSVENVVGSLNGRCPLLLQIKDDWTIPEAMTSLQRTFLRVNDYQWTYPDMKRHVPKNSGDDTYWFDSQVVVLLDMPVNSGLWDIHEVQKPTAPIWLGLIQRADVLNIRLRYDGGRYSRDGVQEMGKTFMDILGQLVKADRGTRINEVNGGLSC